METGYAKQRYLFMICNEPGSKLSSNICHHKRLSQLGVLIASFADDFGLVTRSSGVGTRDEP